MIRRRVLAAFALGLAVMPPAGVARAGGAGDAQNEANNPLTLKLTQQSHDYVQPVLSGMPGSGLHQLYQRLMLPFTVGGVSQLARASMPVVSNSWGPQEASNGIGDLTVFDMVVTTLGKTQIGAGPLFLAPTASAPALGMGRWQLGGQTVLSRPHDWGLTGALTSYQQSPDGSLKTVAVQPLLFYNLPDSWYLRSTATATFNLGLNSVIPVGLGLGRVFERPDGNVVNLYVEPQYSVLQTGVGVPSFQIFFGVTLQFPIRLQRGGSQD